MLSATSNRDSVWTISIFPTCTSLDSPRVLLKGCDQPVSLGPVVHTANHFAALPAGQKPHALNVKHSILAEFPLRVNRLARFAAVALPPGTDLGPGREPRSCENLGNCLIAIQMIATEQYCARQIERAIEHSLAMVPADALIFDITGRVANTAVPVPGMPAVRHRAPAPPR